MKVATMKLNQEKLNNLLSMYRLSTLSKITGINYQTLTRLSRKSRTVYEIELKTAYKLAKGLNITVEELVNKIYDIGE